MPLHLIQLAKRAKGGRWMLQLRARQVGNSFASYTKFFSKIQRKINKQHQLVPYASNEPFTLFKNMAL